MVENISKYKKQGSIVKWGVWAKTSKWKNQNFLIY